MELMLHSLYHNLKDKISLIPLAGTDGFYRMVRWIQFDEYSSNLHLLRSGDLVITTDYNDPADSCLLYTSNRDPSSWKFCWWHAA